MDVRTIKAEVLNWLGTNASLLVFSAATILMYFLLNSLIARLVRRANQGDARKGAALKVKKIVRLVTGFFAILTIMVVWGIDFGSVTIFATTTVTLLGVALFASWSMLSNVTAYFVLLFHPSYFRGNFVRVIEGDNYVEGYVADLSIFSMELITENQERILYPNNLLLGRVAVINPKDRLQSVGKIVNSEAATSLEDSASPPAPSR